MFQTEGEFVVKQGDSRKYCSVYFIGRFFDRSVGRLVEADQIRVIFVVIP